MNNDENDDENDILRKGGGQSPFHLLEGIRHANEAELTLLLQAFAKLQEAHHSVPTAEAEDHHPMKKGIENMKLWAAWQAQFALEPPSAGSGFKIKNAVESVNGMKIIIHKMSQATLYHALMECACLQRRWITGKPYGPYPETTADSPYNLDDLLVKARQGKHGVRYSSYLPMDPTVVLCLCVYVKQNYRLVLADLNDTLVEVFKWNTVVIPEIQDYLAMHK